jgi:hypothetical protein
VKVETNSQSFLLAGGNDCDCDACEPGNARLRSYARACIDEAVAPALAYIEARWRAGKIGSVDAQKLTKLLTERTGT